MTTTVGRVTRYRTWLGHRPVGRIFRPGPVPAPSGRAAPEQDAVEPPNHAPAAEQR